MSAAGAPVVLLASGTRGDVQPYLALALGLRTAGIPAVVAAAPRFRSLVEDRRIAFAALDGNPSDLMAARFGSQPASASGGLARGLVSTARFLRAGQDEYRLMLESAAAVCWPARAILAGLSSTWGSSIAEALGIPLVFCMLQPFGRTRAFPSALSPVRVLPGKSWNALSYRILEQAMWQPWRRITNDWRRRTLGLRSLPWTGPWRQMYATGFACLYGFSAAVVPRPSDWPVDHRVTGYWFLDEPDWRPPPELQRFLSSGSPPVYVGFGSTGMGDDSRAHQATAQALRLNGQRAIIGSSGGPAPGHFLFDGGRQVVVEGHIPHGWLFPRVAAVLHHGGAGTTAEGLRAGVPSIMFPTASDQHFWAERVAKLGAGPPPLTRSGLAPEVIARLLVRTAGDRGMRERARAIGERIRAENGVTAAVEALMRILENGPAAILRRRAPGDSPLK